MACHIFFTITYIAVSYTHLDVYKRQVQQMLEQAMGGEYDGLLSAMIMPVYCDALRSAGQNFKTAVPHIPVIPVVYPANRKGRSGREFLASEYRSAGKALEKITGKKITEKALQDSIEVYNRYRSCLLYTSSVGKY